MKRSNIATLPLLLVAYVLMNQAALTVGKLQNESIRLAVVLPLDVNGVACGKFCSMSVAAVTQAIEVINNKTDGFFDSLLPNTLLEYEFYDTNADKKKGQCWEGRYSKTLLVEKVQI